MDEFLADPPFWSWWILAVALAAIEILAPGVFFIWLGVAAAITGIIMLIVPGIEWQWQVLIFAVLSVISVVSWRIYQKRHPTRTEDTTLNRRGEQYVGRVVGLTEPIINGFGTARIGDSMWRVAGPDLPAGSSVRIVSAAGGVLRVEAEAARAT
jgi:membrane protein implicated in regulation of membrane protease activity